MKTFKELKAQINEASFSKSQLDKLRKEYSGKKKIDTSSKEFQAVVKSFRKLPDNVLKQIRDAKIDHISFLAANIIDEKKRGKGNKYFPGSTTESVDLEEAVSMKNAKGIGFGKRGGYGKYVTLAKKKNAKSYKDVLKVLSREGLGKEELDNVADYVMNALGESVEIELEEDYFSVQYYNGNKNAVDDKFKTFKSKAEADKYAKRGNAVDRVGGEYKVFKVKGRMESVEESKPAGYGNTDVKVGDEFEKNKLTLKVIAVSGKKVTVKKKGKKQSLMPISQFDTWTKINESVELDEVFSQAQMKKAIGIARKSTGNYDKAYAQIEKIKKGLADEDIIAHVLKKANESVEIEEGFRVVGVTTSGEKFKSGILKTQKDADNKHWKLTKATDLRGKKVYKTLKVVKESVELDEGANLQIFKDSGYMMQRNGKGSTFTIFYGKKAVAHGQSKGGKVNPATVNKNTTLTWTIPSKNNMTTPLSGVDAVKYLKKNLIESVELDEGMQLKGIYKALKSLATKPEYKKVKNALNGLADFPPSGSEKKAATSLKKRLGQLSKLVKGKKEQQKLMKLADFTATFESIELDEAYDRGSIRDFKVGDKVKFVDDKSSHHGQTGKITKLIGGIGARQKAHVKLDKTKKTVIDILTSTDLIKEAVSMKNAKGIGFGKKGGYDKYVTLAKKKNAKSHKDVLKVLSREGLGKEELDNVADYVMNALGESVELGEAVLDEGVSSEAKSVMREINKHLKILKTELKTSDVNQDWKARLNRIEGIIGKVKWTVEESLDEAKGSDCTIQNDGRNNIAVCIDGLSFADARKGTRGAMMNIDGFKKKAKVAWADAKGKPTIPAVKKEIKALKAKNFYAKWQADSSSYKDDSVKIWFTK